MVSYTFDDRAADLAVSFFGDALVHVKGPLTDTPFHLLPWQAEIVRNLFGWKREDGTRRYRRCYVEVPRKNGKSSFAAGLAIYLLLFDGEASGEVYGAASTRDQASLVFSIAAEMIRKNPELSAMVKIRDSKKLIMAPRSGSAYRVIPAEAGSAHGFNSSGILMDELHTWPGRQFYDALETSTGARTQPLQLAITTAGHDRSSICWQQHVYAAGVAAGVIDDPTFLPVIFTSSGDWRDEATWVDANPSVGHTIGIEYLREQYTRAAAQPSFRNTFKRLHLNQWTETEHLAFRMDHYDSCAEEYAADQFDGRSAFAACDFSSTRDLTALALVFPRDDEGCDCLNFFWMPEAAISCRASQDQRILRAYAEAGFIQTTPGNTIEIQVLTEALLGLCDRYDIEKIGYDPWNAQGFIQSWITHGVDPGRLLAMRQNYGTYNLPFKTLQTWLASKQFGLDASPAMRWQFSHVRGREDASGNQRPDKSRSADKIDGVCALLMAIHLALSYTRVETAYTPENPGVILI